MTFDTQGEINRVKLADLRFKERIKRQETQEFEALLKKALPEEIISALDMTIEHTDGQAMATFQWAGEEVVILIASLTEGIGTTPHTTSVAPQN